MRIWSMRALLASALLIGTAAAPAPVAADAKYFFHVKEVEAVGAIDEQTRAMTRELLAQELGGRPEFTSDVAAANRAELLEKLEARKLQGFDVNVKLESMKEELKAPRPGGRLKQLAVTVKLSVFGTTMKDRKMAFSGEGEAGIEAEIVERRREEEAVELRREALTQALRQAADEAVAKLGRPKSAPPNEGNRRRKRS